MLQQTIIAGRPATVLYINDKFEPVEQAEATMARVNFTDEQGGSMFLRRDKSDDKYSPEPAGSP